MKGVVRFFLLLLFLDFLTLLQLWLTLLWTTLVLVIITNDEVKLSVLCTLKPSINININCTVYTSLRRRTILELNKLREQIFHRKEIS